MIFFITESYLKQNAPIGNNVDMGRIDYLIPDTYELSIKPLLGSHFSEWLLNKHQQVIAGLDTYTPVEEGLIDLIQRSMAWGVSFNAIETLSDYVTAKGANKGFSDYSSASSDTQVRFLSQKYSQNCEEFKDRIVNYVKRNKSNLTEFTNSLNDDSLISEQCDRNDDLRDLGFIIG